MPAENPSTHAEPHARPAPLTTAQRLADLRRRREQTGVHAERKAADKQHAKGRLTARERIDMLLDPGSFHELDEFARHRVNDFGMDRNRPPGDGVVVGHGTIDGRRVCVFSQDASVFGGSLGEVFGAKVLKVMDLAAKIGCPVIGVNDSGGARIQEGVVALGYYAELGRRTSSLSGMVPQIGIVAGTCAGGAVYATSANDFVVMVAGSSHMFVTGPEVVASITGETVTLDQLGGGEINAEVAGNVHYLAADEKDAVDWVQTLLSYLPGNYLDRPPAFAEEEELTVSTDDLALDVLIPDSPAQAYDMREVIRRVVDAGDFLEIQAQFARNIICAFARIDGHTVGVVANQPQVMAGTLDIDSSEKAARFIRFCDAYSIPIVTLVDVPGYLPGLDQERRAVLRRGSKLFFAYAEATVPMVTVVVRKAYGGGYAVMGSKHAGADLNLAWPTAEIAVIGAEGAALVLHRKELAALPPDRQLARHTELTEHYRRTLCAPYVAADRGYVDEVILPSETRSRIAEALRTLRNKRSADKPRKHDTLPV
jgi:propionyl-CoA carboxylase beta chain